MDWWLVNPKVSIAEARDCGSARDPFPRVKGSGTPQGIDRIVSLYTKV